jgi:hypothetical protein
MTALDAPPAPIDQVTGVATLASLDVRTADQWCVCVCTDDRHAALVTDDLFVDGRWIARECWRTVRTLAERDLLFVPSEHKHIVIRPSRVVTAPVEVDEP